MKRAYQITKIQANVLKELGTYKYLTLSQLLRLNVGTTQYKYLWKQVSMIYKRSRPLVNRVSFNVIDRVSRVEDLYYLTKIGFSIVEDIGAPASQILIPIGTVVSAKDYNHKVSTLDFQITVNEWADKEGFNVGFYQRYFDKKGNNRIAGNLRSINRICKKSGGAVIPDSSFMIESDNFKRLFLMELHFGKDSKRIYNQVTEHISVLLSGVTHAKYNYPKERAYKLLIIFSEERTMKSMIKRFLEHKSKFESIQNLILCHTVEIYQNENFTKGWKTILGEEVKFSV